MSITLYYNAACRDCERKANRTSKLDWFDRIRISTEESPLGPVPKGDIVVTDDATNKVFTGIYATRTICMKVPAYFLYGLALHVAPIRDLFARGEAGCEGDACNLDAE